MGKFRHFITEEIDESKLKHLEHVEDHVLHGGHKGFAHAFHTVRDVHHNLQGHKTETQTTIKYDGSPAVVFGTHPENGKFFVASKSAFNKNPKINHTHEDIQKNHGHAPGLVQKLSAALDHAHKIKPQGIYQADIMHAGDVKKKGNRVEFTPNTITYHTPHDSDHGKAAMKSKLGLAVHTQYEGKTIDSLEAKHAPDMSHFVKHPDVHMMSPHHDTSKHHYTQEDRAKVEHHLEQATAHFRNTPKEHHDTVYQHHEALKTYINHTVRTGEQHSHEGFVAHHTAKHNKKIDSVKTDAAKARHTTTRDNVLNHINTNKEHFEGPMHMHKHLQAAKDILTKTMSQRSEWGHEIAGAPTKPEGFVAIRQGRPSKFVDRKDFSAANFNKG
jgi:hypothetical protein|tara:strand:- start:2406 stop:3560 length:1155 start_codon:yes stop_codon:yes gene_type:complete